MNIYIDMYAYTYIIHTYICICIYRDENMFTNESTGVGAGWIAVVRFDEYICMYMHIYMYVYIHTCIYMHIYIYCEEICSQLNVQELAQCGLQLFSVMNKYMHIFMHIYIYIYICIYIYAYIYIHIFRDEHIFTTKSTGVGAGWTAVVLCDEYGTALPPATPTVVTCCSHLCNMLQ